MNKIMNTKIEYFFEKKIKVHVITSPNNTFYNGLILDNNSEKELMILLDDKFGEVPILYEEINRIEPYKEARK